MEGGKLGMGFEGGDSEGIAERTAKTTCLSHAKSRALGVERQHSEGGME